MKNLLTPHQSSSLEYLFFKVNAGPVAILVDWIARRKLNQHWLRVSIHSPHKREVLSGGLVELVPKDNYMTLQRTAGHINGIAWELDIDPGMDTIKPDIFPSALLRVPDLTLVSAPLASFNGWIKHGGLEFKLNSARGMMAHYWGRQLLSTWWWISANQFDQEGISLEVSLFTTSLWGTGLKSSFAYLYLLQPNSREFVTLLPGMATVNGTPENFEITVRRLGKKPIIIKGKGREYGDLGDGIANTLVGDLELWTDKKLIARADGTACIERRSK